MTPYTPPSLNLSAFNCAHCNAYANQLWSPSIITTSNGSVPLNSFKIATCTHCGKYSSWFKDQMIYPNKVTAPLPNNDLPDDIKVDFEEARQIANLSPKGAAALLRLVIQKICIYLGEPGKNINKDIGELVKNGLSPVVQRSLDIVRVVGNESVHPGVIDLNDDPETVKNLFKLINIIADTMITRPKEIDMLYGSLPSDKREAIQKRDEKA